MKFLKKRKNRTNCLPLQELLKMEVPKDVECDYLAEFVKTSRKKQIIPELEAYIAGHKENPYWAYYFLLHYSFRLETNEKYRERLREAEHILHMDEISILFPEPRFKDPSQE